MLGADYDQDGLSDTMEVVLGTLPDVADTDGDGFLDLEEVARTSDPLDSLSLPGAMPLSIGTYSYEESGYLAFHAAIFVDDGDTSGLDFELGVILNGTPVTVSRQTYANGTIGFLYPSPSDPKDKILVVGMLIPTSVVAKLGQLDLYTVVRDTGPLQRPSAISTSSIFSSPTGLFELVPAPAPIAANKGGGIVYRPLTGDGSVPQGTTAGQVCWQNISAVGSSGSNIVYEVEQAGCEDFDGYCNATSCAAKIGTSLHLPDPGAILGG
ncbi:MAG TPA: hypothetical protein ENJ09_01305 [Planctomycetes bacterium]|nr:hypothetical protein [Planctomycetota bacterium]